MKCMPRRRRRRRNPAGGVEFINCVGNGRAKEREREWALLAGVDRSNEQC